MVLIVGGWKSVDVTEELRQLLLMALERAAADDVQDHVEHPPPEQARRLRVLNVRSVGQQTVAGTNYRFSVDALLDGQEPARAVDVTVFEQRWTDTLRVTAVEPRAGE